MKALHSYLIVLLVLLSFTAKGRTYPLRDTLSVTSDSLHTTLSGSMAAKQDTARRQPKTPIMFDTLLVKPDSLRTALPDSTAAKQDSTQRKSSLDAPVFSTGRDSTIYDFPPGENRMIYYYGDVKVKYGDLELASEYMAYDVEKRIVFAEGIRDSTGKWTGSPVMREAGKEYRMENVYYNFSTKKAIIKNVITTEGEAFLHGSVIKKMPDNSININGGKYTTCDLDHPHFYMQLTKAKVVPEPNSQTVFGPAYLVIEDVPTPLALPFGFFPKRNDRSGGFLFPTFGEEPSRGFYVTGIGWYFVFGEYFDFAVTMDYFTLGSWGVQAVSRYKKNYKFSGDFNFKLSETVTGDASSTDYMSSRDFSIGWSHVQDPKANPEVRFNASVNFMTSSFRQYNSMTNPINALQSTAQSSVNFSRAWEGSPFNLSVTLTHNQNMRDSTYNFGIPNFTFSMNTIYPFKRKHGVGKERLYEKVSFGYNTTFDNKLVNIKSTEFGGPEFWDKMQTGMAHNFSIGLPSFSLLKYVTVAPGFSYGMNMYFQGLEKDYNEETGLVEDVRSRPFSEFHVTNRYSFSVSADTRLYGTFLFGKGSYIQAVRHMLSPRISASFSPDERTAANGYRTYYYVDTLGQSHSVPYNAFSGAYAAPSGGRSASLNFSLGNNLEMKVLSKKDTVNGGVKKLKLIDNLNFSGSYNFLADSMKLSVIGVNLSTSLFEKVGINANATLDPYAVSNGSRIDKFCWNAGQGFLRLVGASFSFGYEFKGGEEGIKNNPTSLEGVRRYDPETGNYLYTEYLFYNDFKAPWSFGFNYGFNYTANYVPTATGTYIKQNTYSQTLGFNGSIKLTEAFTLTASSGFDFQQLKLTTTQLNIHYDLHCFEFTVGWVPFGQYQSWNFRFNAKSSMLSDLLKYDKRTNYTVY